MVGGVKVVSENMVNKSYWNTVHGLMMLRKGRYISNCYEFSVLGLKPIMKEGLYLESTDGSFEVGFNDIEKELEVVII